MTASASVGRCARRKRARPPAVEIVVDSPRWKVQRNAGAVVRRAIGEAARTVAPMGGEVAVVLTDDSSIRALNRTWRSKNAATNVLSFPVEGPHAAACSSRNLSAGNAGRHRLLGDIVIAYETTEREARAEHKLFTHHLAHLAVHGFLHLVGYNHLAEPEARAMERLETTILDRLDIADPYAAPGARR